MRDLRNIRELDFELSPGLNVFAGRNAQGKTTLLEAVGLLSRGRSFRTERMPSLIRRGASALWARGLACDGGARETALEVELGAGARRLRIDGREVGPRSYQGRLEVVVYSTERLRVVRGSMRDRRQYLDRAGAALWPAYRQALREYERVLLQRNAALQSAARDREVWDERLIQTGASLRLRRAAYVGRLRQALAHGFSAAGERYSVRLGAEPDSAAEAREALAAEISAQRGAESRARRSLVGPHRDPVELSIDGVEAESASSGQARSLLLALSMAALEIYRAERGTPAVALLDDLDSELDETRAFELCRDVAGRGQALVTTAHADWARSIGALGRSFEVTAGRVAPLGVS